MTSEKSLLSTLTRFINFITFVDLPIRRKFLLFGFGVFFWFITLFAVLGLTLFDLEGEASMIVKRVLPQERMVETMFKNLRTADVRSLEVMRETDVAEVMQKGEHVAQVMNEILAGLDNFKDVGNLRRRAGLKSLLTGSMTGTTYNDTLISDIDAAVKATRQQFAELVAIRLAVLRNDGTTEAKAVQKLGEVRRTIDHGMDATSHLSSEVAGLYVLNTELISSSIRYAVVTGITVLGIATLLLALFTFWIARSIVRPVNSIISEIHSLSTGDVDLSKRIKVATKDEIGKLSEEFNGLMESIHAMTVYKRVIEEDESLEDVYSRLGKVIADNLGSSEYTIYEISNSKNRMKPVYPVSLNDHDLSCDADILGNCELCKAKKTGHEVSSLDYPRICKMFAGDAGFEHLCVPMIIEGSAGGVVQLRFKRPEGDGAIADLQQRVFRARQYVRQSVSVIEAKRLMGALRDSALKDQLTGLHNRRFLQEYTESLVAGVQRRGNRIGLIMCDLDYFKQVNDLYGHQAGDAVLKEAALAIKRSVRESDFVIRFGGEEFLVVVLDLTDESAKVVAEKIRETVEKIKIQVPHGPVITKTISLGISEFPDDTDSFWQAIKFADVALYRAKETGRNRSVRFTREMWGEEQF
jgi:diguanylate cyclase (GGDEF)-like protein